MVVHFHAERALSPIDDANLWVVVDSQFRLHPEGCTFLAGLRALGRSSNTERAYAGRVALFLTWCDGGGLDWRRVGMLDLARFLRWLVSEPLPPRGKTPAEPRFRSKKTANAVVTAVCEFFRFAAREGWVDPSIIARLSEPKYLGWLPPGFDTGEDGQFRQVKAKMIKFEVGEDPIEILRPEDADRLIKVALHARDRFLIALLSCTGIRIGEALGLRREDMHFLADSKMLGCHISGPHIHVRRRPDNANGALAKSRFSRSIPVLENVVGLYADYQYERDAVPEAAACDMVFVNLFHAPLGSPLRYWTVKELFDRLARETEQTARPHMLRHGAATAWIRSGVPQDVVQELMGHVSPASLAPYLHPTDEEKREAVMRVAERGRR
ncbi:tyrosine-type recombinase/integrase [Kitasatospora sp. NPDC056531]|uniref:tyrosine-type recombinase/integrase n=1 Tax=Kitasatospora sp. NPDC056531 TaxID=3345856 RepID=UPI00369E9046